MSEMASPNCVRDRCAKASYLIDGPNSKEQSHLVSSGSTEGKASETEARTPDSFIEWRRWWRCRFRCCQNRCCQCWLHRVPFRGEEYSDSWLWALDSGIWIGVTFGGKGMEGDKLVAGVGASLARSQREVSLRSNESGSVKANDVQEHHARTQ